MQDKLQLLSGAGIGEHKLAHARPVQCPAGIDEMISKNSADRFYGRTAGLGNCIAVDDGGAQFGKQSGNSALAAADAAGQADVVASRFQIMEPRVIAGNFV